MCVVGFPHRKQIVEIRLFFHLEVINNGIELCVNVIAIVTVHGTV